MTLLEDPGEIRAGDPAGMLEQVAGLGEQLRRGYEAARGVEGLPTGVGVRAVAVCGMGGSGVGGDVLRALYSARSPVPIDVVKGYLLPEHCQHDTLVVVQSFSGATEEMLAIYEQARARGCRLATVGAGGELADRSAEDGVAHVRIPADVPMPRAAIGFLSVAPIGILEGAGLIPPAAPDVTAAARLLDDLADRLGPEVPPSENPAKALASWIGGRTPVIWGSEGVSAAAAVRWRTQVNENAKGPAFWSALSELDHNEIEGWSAGTGMGYALVVLRHEGEHPRVGARVSATLAAIEPAGLEAREIHGEGATEMARLFSLIAIGDFVSTYLAILRGVDPMPVPTLMRLKEQLRERPA